MRHERTPHAGWRAWTALCLRLGFVALVLSLASAAQAAKSEIEQYLNPFGDEWSLAVTNPDIPLMAPFPCLRSLPEKFWTITPEQHAFVAAIGATLAWAGCTNLMSPPDLTPRNLRPKLVLDRITNFTLHHPDQSFLGYYAIAEFASANPGAGEIAKNHKDWFLYRSEGEPTQDNFVLARRGARILDITNPDFQRFVADQIRTSLNAYGLDGFLADGVYPDLTTTTSERYLPEAALKGWREGWLNLIRTVKEAIGPEKLILANVNERNTDFAKDVLQVADGVFLEDPLGALATDLEKSGQRAVFESAIEAAVAADKYVINVVNTNANKTNFETTSPELEHEYARYYTAGHLIFFQGAKALLLYYTPSESGPQFRSEPFFTDWNLRIGKPTDRYRSHQRGIYSRAFENGQVYLNNSAQPFEVVFDECCVKFTPEGTRAESYTIAPKSGMIFVDEAPADTAQ